MSDDLKIQLWILAIAIICNVSCALLGCYLVLRRLSLMGDAISHAVLPGIALAFLLTGQLTSMVVLLGALAMGVLTAFLTQTLQRFGHVAADASLGIVFTTLFALGVVLLKFMPHTDLDPGCIFYGLLEFVPLHTTPWLGLEIPQAFPVMGLVLLLTLAFIGLFWKELKIASFDPGLATAMGLKATLMHYLLMAMVAGVTVSAFEAVGAILVIAMLIVPAATAQLLTERLPSMLMVAAGVGVVSALGGQLLAPADANLSGMMAVMAGGQFFIAVLLAPRHGLLARLLRNTLLAVRIAAEDILANLYRLEETGKATMQPVPGLVAWLAYATLRRQGQITILPVPQLTETGRLRAQSLVRAHRLWEAYLDKNFELPADHLHEPAARMEHFLDPALQQDLAAELDQPGLDPHGRAIPPEKT